MIMDLKSLCNGAKVITRCSFAVFLMTNFASACEISLFNPLEFLFVYLTNVKTELTFGAFCKSCSVFQ